MTAEPPSRPRFFYLMALIAIACGLVAAVQIGGAIEADPPQPVRSTAR